ncbi:MAG: tRNA pseudouridine(13) synthase TruD [Methanomicrobiales archaeon]|nr:tRNA pseudouridine(13) synthase TruD [Methanomicrobiales archaeon]
MMRSPHPLEIALGMHYYATFTPGIGGALRRSPEDFVVEELSVPPENEGPYLLCRLTKKNWEMQRVVKEIAKSLHISPKRISWAGTKDRRAVTTQMISIYGVDPEAIASVSLREIELAMVGRSRRGLSLGMLQGNRFRIRIRDCDPEDLEARVHEMAASAKVGFPNYYGIQRFGVIRPVTHIVGERLLQGDPRGAVMAYVGIAFKTEPDEAVSAREAFLRSEDTGQALREFPRTLSFERAILQSLHNHPGDFLLAIQCLPPKLLSMFVSAFQSYLFNIALSERWQDGLPLHEPRIGDLLIFGSGRVEKVTAGGLEDARMHCRRGRANPALYIPGAKESPLNEVIPPIVRQFLMEKGITESGFKLASEMVGARFDGFYRPVTLCTKIASEVEDTNVLLEFVLQPGQYATTVCREFMKADPFVMV